MLILQFLPSPRVRVRLVYLVLTVCCLTATHAPAVDLDTAASRGQVARSSNGMVSTASALATQAGVEIMEMGGNAVDAAVAAKFAITVALPSMAGIGGRTQILLRTADGEFVGIDGGTQVPSTFHSDGPPGYRTIGIPGTVSALYRVQRAYGQLDFAEVVMPAIRLAEEGFPMPEDEALRHAEAAEELARYSGTRSYYLKEDGSPYAPGEHFRHPVLAKTLRLIAEGGEDAFYRGPIAELIERDMADHGGFLNREELAAYGALEHPVYTGSYRGYPIYGTYRPATGVNIIHILNVMDNLDLPAIAGKSQWVSQVAQAILVGRENRQEAPELQMSREFAAERVRHVDLSGAPSEEIGDGEEGADTNTTHLSTADRYGNVVAMTGSIGPSMGSHVASPGLGFLYAQTMHYSGNRPGSRPTTNMTPLIITDQDGRPLHLLGGAGGARIVSAVVLTISRLLDEGLPMDQAVAAPRFHPLSNNRIRFEVREGASWSEDERDAVGELGYRVLTSDSPTYFGRVHAVSIEPENREFFGVADPRRAGTSGGPR